MHPLAQLINSQQRHTRQQVARPPRRRAAKLREAEENEAQVVATAPARRGRIRVAISWAGGRGTARRRAL